MYFNNQWEDRVGFNLELPNYEYLSTESFSYLDLAVGLQARNQLINDWTITYGLSILHLNTPNESFYNQSNAIGLRYIAHIMSENKLSESVMLQSSAYFTYQKKAIEALIGISAIIAFKSANNKKQSKLIGGLLYRYNDALSPVLGYQYYKTKITTNFDFNLSSLTKASKGNGGFEIAITQVGLWNNKLPSQRKMNCYEF